MKFAVLLKMGSFRGSFTNFVFWNYTPCLYDT